MVVPLPRMRDWVLPVALGGLTVADVWVNGTPAFPSPAWLAAVVLVAACVVLLWRRRWPAPASIGAATLVGSYLLFVHEDVTQQPAIEPFLIMLVAFFALGLHASHRSLLIGATGSAVLLLSAQGLALAAGRPVGEVFPSVLFWGVAGTVGRLLHHHQRQAQMATKRAAAAELDRDLRVRQAAAAERTRIARELHDVIAHSLSVIVIQASVEARLHQDPDGSTARTLRTIENTGREALADLRRLLGLLRTDEAICELGPLPSMRDLDSLLEQLRQAGLNVSVHVTGEPRDLTPGIDLSAYRIAQEALTNALRHAPGATVRVNLTYREEAVIVAVEDDGAAQTPSSAVPGSGQGLVGMRERVRLYGGHLEAGPLQSGGFAVRAAIPAPSDPA